MEDIWQCIITYWSDVFSNAMDEDIYTETGVSIGIEHDIHMAIGMSIYYTENVW